MRFTNFEKSNPDRRCRYVRRRSLCERSDRAKNDGARRGKVVRLAARRRARRAA